ncbi:MAG: RNA polymerase sigma factor [Gammaproteobacteria bacterium]
MHEDRDTALILDCQRGDRRAQTLLINRYVQPIFNAAYRMLGDREEARDVTQTVFLKAFEHLERFDPKYRFFSWIYRIAVNESIDQLHRRGPPCPADARQVSEARGPAELAESSEVCASVQSVLMELPPDYRAVIVLRHFADLSYQEIAQTLEIPVKTVKSRIFSARHAMKDKLQARGVRPQ